MAITVFYSYSHKDETYKEILQTHLFILKRQGFLEGWDDRRIAPGEKWEEEINLNLQKAKIILLLVSSNFLASDYCYDSETIFALEQHEKHNCVVVPIIIKPCLWSKSHFKHLQALPKNGKPITTWKNKDEAWLNVSEGVLKVVESFNKEHPIEIIGDGNVTNQTADKIVNIDKIDTADFNGGGKKIEDSESLNDILVRFLSKFENFYFSPLRIFKWGSQQFGFETISSYNVEMIKSELENLFKFQKVKTTLSKKGNKIYKITSR